MNIDSWMMLIFYILLLPGVISVSGTDKQYSGLELIATFDHQITGVSVHPASGRIFVNFPRWTEDSPASEAEVLTPNISEPFPPKSDWNSWRNTRKNELDPAKYFICVQSVVVFKDSLYVLDPAAPAFGPVVKGGAKLVEFDLIKNKTKRIILLNEQVAPHGSYLNDVRFSPDGKFAYITDSSAIGAIVVVDLKKQNAKRVLHGHP
jgi:DNA-binding beta-propeller fold protein YncE